MSSSSTPPIIVMGVQGSGKSTIGRELAAVIGATFIDGDDLHSAEAKATMAAGTALTDDDRAPWLARVAQAASDARSRGELVVLACSALKRRYRDSMREVEPSLVFVHLSGRQDLVADRLSARNHEYMPTTLLDSQFATLEPLASDEAGLSVDVTAAPDEIVRLILKEIEQR
ncbi:gluconokinase [Mycetocola sp. CAN_C7]|uniref:gluconokinase n=1 Tax=Mycetocola sp. CAN_C7 TaxID=2787724 RepID=UPI001A31EF09